MFIVMLVLYRKSRKDKFEEENRSLISAEAGSAVGMGLDWFYICLLVKKLAVFIFYNRLFNKIISLIHEY